MFVRWIEWLPREIELMAAKLSDESRYPSFTQAKTIADFRKQLADEIEAWLDRPFAFFGHSMGALVGFELARELRARALPEPNHLFISASRAPQLPALQLELPELPTSELLAEVSKFGGMHEAVLQNAELMEIVLPRLRADLRICKGYLYNNEAPLRCSITAFGGLNDAQTTRDELLAWKSQTEGAFCLRLFPGNHFFLDQQPSVFRAILQEELQALVQTS
jgi:medium-chain acyl-[acyl-carrier-protein] hydrolase